jgi:tyrosine-protein kinase Etk/Wzc
MENSEIELKNYLSGHSKSLKDYFRLIRKNIKTFIIIVLIIFIVSLVYALHAPNVYSSTVTLQLTEEPKNNFQLTTPNSNSSELDRFISNQIQIINNFATRERVAKALIDSVENSKNKNIFNLLKTKDGVNGISEPQSISDVAEMLKSVVSVEQKPQMDIVEITAESSSPQEAALIANTYADQYKKINLEENRKQLSDVRKFLEKQSKEKLAELDSAENALTNFKTKGKIVALDAQSTALINQLSQLNSQRDAVKIDLMSSNQILEQYKEEIRKQNPQLVNYLENLTSQDYIDLLQKQIAELQMNRDMAMLNKASDIDVSNKIKEYDQKINDLKQKLSSKMSEIKTSAFSYSPDQIKDQTQRMMDEEVRNHSLAIKLNELESIINKYNAELGNLPQKSMRYSDYERTVESLVQLYTLIEQKYQQAILNENSQPGNVIIIGEGRVPSYPEKPSRLKIMLIGLVAGLGIAFGYVLIKSYFDNTIKSPDDIEGRDIKLLAWIPQFKKIDNNNSATNKVIMLEEHQSSAREAFKVIRARLQMKSLYNNSEKVILISSAGQGEGKTMVSTNLAYSMAQLKKRTLLIDFDLRIPQIHKIMKTDKAPGITDYLENKVPLNKLVKKERDYLYYITAGSLIQDSTELFYSKEIGILFKEIRNNFDFIIVDSAPIVPVIDSEILAKYVDGIILVVSADKTDVKLLNKAINIIKVMGTPFLGTILNNFRYKNGYGYYNKYYYNYPSSSKS